MLAAVEAGRAPAAAGSEAAGQPLLGVRVCIVRHACFPDDPTVRKEARALVRAGCEVDVLCLRRTGQAARERVEGVQVYRLPLSHRRAGVARYLVEYLASLLLNAAALGWLSLRRRYHLVQVNTMPDALVFSTLIPRLLGAGVVLHLHEPTPELWLTKYGPDRLRLLHWLQVKIEQAAIRYAHASLTVSEALRRRYVQRGADGARIGVLRNVCDDDAFSAAPSPAARAGGGFRVVTHGLVEERCGQATLVEAAALLADELPDLTVEILGDGPFRAELAGRVAAAGLAGRVSLPGFLPAAELLERLRRADAGVVAMARTPYSELVDTTKMYEYVALGVPVIASRLPVVEETFDEGAIAYFEPGDARGLAEQIRRLYHAPDERRSLAAAALRRFEPMRWRRAQRDYTGLVARLARRAA